MGGEIPQPGPVVRLASGSRADARVPDYGEDTQSVLSELGLGATEIEELRKSGVV